MKNTYTPSKYRYVIGRKVKNDVVWYCTLDNNRVMIGNDEKKAALHVDKELIKRGEEPVNVLKRL